jgi:hypothetical protein
VLPQDFSFRPVLRIGALPEADIFLPSLARRHRQERVLFLLGRMKSGVTQERAEVELTAMGADDATSRSKSRT